MKRIFLSFLVFCIATMLAVPSLGIVINRASFTDEATASEALRAALDNDLYDTVIVEGTFDIGPSVLHIVRPVKLTTDSGATIKGGSAYWLVWIHGSSGLVEINGNGKKLHLEGPNGGILCYRPNAFLPNDAVKIVDCKITGPGEASYFQGIMLFQYPVASDITPWDSVVIEDNEISGFLSGIDGILFKNASIKRNTIENTELYGIHIPQCDPVLFNCSYQPDSLIEVDDNVITDCGKWAICIGFSDTATAYARHNKITRAQKGFDLRAAYNLHVEGNVITDASDVGIALLGTEDYPGVSNSTFKANKITGSGKYGIKLEDSSTGNTFLGNNLATFSHPEDGALYYFDETSCDNIVKGYTGGANGVVLDNCGNNDITSPKQ